MTSIEVEYEHWAYGEGWSAGLLEGRRRGFEEGYGAGFDSGAEIGAARILLQLEQALDGQSPGLLPELLPDLPYTEGYAAHRRRTPRSDKPCAYMCGACSRCVRAAAVAANRAQHGGADYPGRGPVQKGRS
jgi:hypothetical protein